MSFVYVLFVPSGGHRNRLEPRVLVHEQITTKKITPFKFFLASPMCCHQYITFQYITSSYLILSMKQIISYKQFFCFICYSITNCTDPTRIPLLWKVGWLPRQTFLFLGTNLFAQNPKLTSKPFIF